MEEGSITLEPGVNVLSTLKKKYGNDYYKSHEFLKQIGDGFTFSEKCDEDHALTVYFSTLFKKFGNDFYKYPEYVDRVNLFFKYSNPKKSNKYFNKFGRVIKNNTDQKNNTNCISGYDYDLELDSDSETEKEFNYNKKSNINDLSNIDLPDEYYTKIYNKDTYYQSFEVNQHLNQNNNFVVESFDDNDAYNEYDDEMYQQNKKWK